MKAEIKNHSQFNINDYEYLSEKGYSDKEILEIWDRDAADGHPPVTINKNKVDWTEMRNDISAETLAELRLQGLC